MCSPKEPYYFSTDISSQRAASSEEEYAHLFKNACPDHKIGEASTTYLRSEVAVPRILEMAPDSQFVVCLRNPVDMMPSVHMQLFRGGRETISDVEKAWDAQDQRKQGKRLPSFCPEPADLYYAENCALGAQVTRLLARAPRQQVHFVMSEDMRVDPRSVYSDVLNFLGVSDDGRDNFVSLNARRAPRSARFSQVLARGASLKRSLGLSGSLGVGNILAKLNSQKPIERSPVDTAFRDKLKSFFQDDIALLEKAVERDLSDWLK